MTTIDDLPIDVLEYMIVVGELDGQDVWNLCRQNDDFRKKCKKQRQRIYRTILL